MSREAGFRSMALRRRLSTGLLLSVIEKINYINVLNAITHHKTPVKGLY
jgi:hypothetical protein